LEAVVSLDALKTATSIAADVVTTAAIVVGGVWAYWRFIRERTRWPRASLELVIAHYKLTESTIALNAKIKVHNKGKGLMKLQELRVDLYRVLPVSIDFSSRVDSGSLVPNGEVEAEWPPIDQRKCKWADKCPELEPAEEDEYSVDFSVSSSDEVVFIYAYLCNVAKQRGKKELGWPITSFYDLRDQDGRRFELEGEQ
jgi:hypothetical protein